MKSISPIPQPKPYSGFLKSWLMIGAIINLAILGLLFLDTSTFAPRLITVANLSAVAVDDAELSRYVAVDAAFSEAVDDEDNAVENMADSAYRYLSLPLGLLMFAVNPLSSLLSLETESASVFLTIYAALSLMGFIALLRHHTLGTYIFYLSFGVTLIFTLAQFVFPNPALIVVPMLLWYLTQDKPIGLILAELWQNQAKQLLTGAVGGVIGGVIGGATMPFIVSIALQQITGAVFLNLTSSMIFGMQGGTIIGLAEGIATSVVLTQNDAPLEKLGQLAFISGVVGFLFSIAFWLIA